MATWRSASIVAATLQGRTGRRLSRSPNATSRHRRRLPKDRWIRGGSGLLGGIWWTWTGSNRRPLPCHLRNISHLQTVWRKTKDLARGDVDSGGRHRRLSGLLDFAPGCHSERAQRVPPRAVASRCDCCLLEETTFWFPYKEATQWSCRFAGWLI